MDDDFASQFARDRRPVCQLYLISPLDVGGVFPERLRRALDAGPVAAFQFRVKGIDQHAAVALAEPLQRICADADVNFIVNDSASLAKRIGADGVHLGQGDGDVREAREVLGREAQIGGDVSRQPPSGDGGRGGGGGLCRVRRFLSDHDQGDDASAGTVDPKLVDDAVPGTVRGNRRNYAGECAAIGGRGCRLPRGSARRSGQATRPRRCARSAASSPTERSLAT